MRWNNERDVVAEDIRKVILVHEEDGNQLLWPVLWQQTSDNNSDRILGTSVCVYIAEFLENCPLCLQNATSDEMYNILNFHTARD